MASGITACSVLVATTASAAPTAPAPAPPRLSTAPNTAWLAGPQGGPDVSWRARDLQDQLVELDHSGAVGVVAAAQSRRGQWSGAAGERTAHGDRAMAGDKIRIGSLTKPMVATVLMQLVQERKLALHTPVDEVLPDLLGSHGSAVTLEQLLSHRSGLPDYLIPSALAEPTASWAQFTGRPRNDRTLIKQALRAGWQFTPGTRSSYSNTNYLVAGLMAQKVTGRTIQDLVRQRVFGPAGMKDSAFPTDTTFPDPHLSEYTNVGTGLKPFSQNASQFGAAGAVVSTPEDLNRFWRSLFTGHLVKSRTVNTMIRPRGTLSGNIPYGLGIMQVPARCGTRAETVYGHDGATWGTLTVALSTRDGRAQASTGLTGRTLLPTEVKKQPAPGVATLPAMQYACSD